MCSRFWKSISLIVLGLLGLTSASSATQTIDGADKAHVSVNVSAREVNRVAVLGRRITTAVPGQPGLLSYRKDEAYGALYLTLAATAAQAATGPVTLFVTDEGGQTYKLILVPRSIPGEEIVIRPPADRSPMADRPAGQLEARAASYQRHVKNMLVAMMSGRPEDASLEAVEVGRDVPLWKESRLTFVAKFIDPSYVGEKYRLVNTSNSDMLLAEPELYRRGVRAIVIKSQTLPPAGSTDIYIVRERNESE